jgi:hypothetical protein
VLRELGLVKQRYQAVREVSTTVPVTDVASRQGISRQTVHEWLVKYVPAPWRGRSDSFDDEASLHEGMQLAAKLIVAGSQGSHLIGRGAAPGHTVAVEKRLTPAYD